MKKYVLCILLLLLLTGCSSDTNELNEAMHLRSRILKSSECCFTTEITAEYGDRICLFAMDCTSDNQGNLTFTVVEPVTISGISGKLTGDAGVITFDDMTLQFPLSADNLPSPISAPWIMMKALRSGFLTSSCLEDGELRLSINDSYKDDAMNLDIWLNNEQLPKHIDILHNGKRILTMNVTKFEIS